MLIALFLLLVFGVSAYFVRKSKIQKLIYKTIIARLEERKLLLKEELSNGKLTSALKNSSQNGTMMSEYTEVRFLEELELMEVLNSI